MVSVPIVVTATLPCALDFQTFPIDVTEPIRHVPYSQRHTAAWLARFPALGPLLAKIESAGLRDAINAVQMRPPVWICGMARAGSTILLEIINSVDGLTSHRYSDYPWLWTPYWRNYLRQRTTSAPVEPHERAHRDRILVTPDSPEAFEEVFWMHFFAGRHIPNVDQVLDSDTDAPLFAQFLDDHMRKLLAVRGATRYVAKANYHLARLGFLHKLYPRARFIIPIREPLAQIASLMRQDALFRRMHAEDAAVGAHLARCGHFEFGPQRRVYNVGDAAAVARVGACFGSGDNALGYAQQWAMQYGYAQKRIANDPVLAAACLWVSHERLCADPESELRRIGAHLDLANEAIHQMIDFWAERISAGAESATKPERKLVSQLHEITESIWTSAQRWAHR